MLYEVITDAIGDVLGHALGDPGLHFLAQGFRRDAQGVVLGNQGVDAAAQQRAAGAIDRASAVFIGSGADMALDSGLPDFSRMLEPQNEALPTMFRKTDLVTSGRDVDSWFRQHPEQAWGFFAHRNNFV